jgi:DNA polymerase-1
VIESLNPELRHFEAMAEAVLEARNRYRAMSHAFQREFREKVVAEASETGYVTTLLGRRRPIPQLASGQRQRQQLGERLAVNALVQGTAADIMKIAMLRCHRQLADQGLESRIILQIHDELLFEGPESEAEEVRDLAIGEMVSAFELDPPLEVDAGIGPDWLSVK